MIRVLIADDQELVRDGLALILGAQLDIEVIGLASDGADAVRLTRDLRPDVVLMDVRMPRLDGIEATRLIVDRSPQTRVLVLTTYDVDDHVLGALRAGASGFLLKDTPRRSLIASVRAVAEGDVLLDADVTHRLVSQLTPSTTPDVARALATITEREQQVWREVAKGLSNAEIATQLGIGAATVKTHVAKLLEKLGARDRVQLVVLAYATGVASA